MYYTWFFIAAFCWKPLYHLGVAAYKKDSTQLPLVWAWFVDLLNLIKP